MNNLNSSGDLSSGEALPPETVTGQRPLVDGREPTRQLNALLRGEISAAETYRMALEELAHGKHMGLINSLRQIQKEHGRACQTLRDRIRELGEEAADSSGLWGTWAEIVQEMMSRFGGDHGAIKSLKEGEEHGLKDYREALPALDATSASVIENQMIPAQEKHINLLEQFLAAVDA